MRVDANLPGEKQHNYIRKIDYVFLNKKRKLNITNNRRPSIVRTLYRDKKALILVAALACAWLLAPSFVSAQDDTRVRVETEETTTTIKDEVENDTTEDTSTKTDDRRTETRSSQKDAIKAAREEHKELAREKLDAVKQKVCETREAQVNKIMDGVVSRSQGHVDRITEIATRTKAFYDKQGNTVDTYFALVASVETARQAAQAAVDALSTNADFTCASDGPKSDIQGFRNQRLTKIAAIGTYRNEVKKLIVAVKSVQPTVEKETN